MALTIESVSTGQSPIAKPTGLAVGELMLANAGHAYVSEHVTPAGWTSLGTAGTFFHTWFYKVADASDVAASTFAFTDLASHDLYATMYRISNSAAIYSNVFVAGTSDNNTSFSFTIDVAVPHANAHVFVSYMTAANTNNGSYTCTGSPTFTERGRATPSFGGGNICYTVADAPLSSPTTLTSIGFGTGVTATDANLKAIVLYQQADGTLSPSLLTAAPEILIAAPWVLSANPQVYSPTVSLGDEIDWTNDTGTTPPWTNES